VSGGQKIRVFFLDRIEVIPCENTGSSVFTSFTFLLWCLSLEGIKEEFCAIELGSSLFYLNWRISS
jgi:hypothetical protein